MGGLLLVAGVGILLGLVVVGGILALLLKQDPVATEQPTTPAVEAPAELPVVAPEPEAEALPPAETEAEAEPVALEAVAPVVGGDAVPSVPVVPAPEPEPELEGAAQMVEVRVASVPAGARVRVGADSVQAPGVLTLPAGTVTARVSFPDSSGGSCVLSADEGAKWKFRADGGSVVCP